jgi:hypothetical protein
MRSTNTNQELKQTELLPVNINIRLYRISSSPSDIQEKNITLRINVYVCVVCSPRVYITGMLEKKIDRFYMRIGKDVFRICGNIENYQDKVIWSSTFDYIRMFPTKDMIIPAFRYVMICSLYKTTSSFFYLTSENLISCVLQDWIVTSFNKSTSKQKCYDITFVRKKKESMSRSTFKCMIAHTYIRLLCMILISYTFHIHFGWAFMGFVLEILLKCYLFLGTDTIVDMFNSIDIE